MEGATPKGQASKDYIITQSLAVFMQQGYAGTSLQEICRVVGLSKGALYHHFQGKDDLYYQCLERFFCRPMGPSWRVAPADSLRERLHAGFRHIDQAKRDIHTWIGSDDDDAILRFYSFLYEATRRYPEFQQRIDQGDDGKLQELTDAFRAAQQHGEIRRDLDPFLLAMELEAQLQQLLYLRFVNHRMKAADHLLDELFESYWKRLEA
ncbi:TetR/AcrR family transcriptional regulator [Spirochaeta africana]|uniref:Transcriptional regulator n=1 Tax=Spirochaeta africana (strain ATCC 700263 / DSM 8902 / Z-7692) TaxID=889378 RepID=H9UM69_SPIAZ|nr:TetR/AcrR family transcriptional regulator [Spirochaeta africana]AFG38612.1 transcriptional regulator [Spirochaeta africana DSM 8902]